MGKLLIPDALSREENFEGNFEINGWVQTDGYSCGYAAAFTLLDYFGVHTCTNQLWKELKPHKDDGVTTSNLLNALRSRGLIMTRKPVTATVLREAFQDHKPVLLCSRLESQPPGEEHWMIGAGIWGQQVLLLNQPSITAPRTWWYVSKLVRRASDPICWVARKR
jgi:predicted double-glycine peptidase